MHYPLDFRRFRKRDQSDEEHPKRDQSDEEHPFKNHIHAKERAYIGDLKANRTMVVSGQETTVSAWVAILTPMTRTKFTVADRTQWYFTKSIRLHKVNDAVRILVFWSEADAVMPHKILVTNRTHWEAHRMLKVYRRR